MKLLERQIHLGVVHLLRLAAAPGVVWWHTANERKTSPRQGALLKNMGVLPGVADFIILIPVALRPLVVFLELKRPGGKLTESQSTFRDSVERAGCYYFVAESVEEAAEVLRGYHAIH